MNLCYVTACVSLPAGIRVVSNAGGINPLMCAAALDQMARKAGVDLKIAVVTGDDILGEVTDISVIRS